MIINAQVPLHRLVLSLSEAMDCVHPCVADHQHRVAYISLGIARQLRMPKSELLDLFLAAALHDIGLMRYQDRLDGLYMGKLENVAWHAEVGCRLLGGAAIFRRAAQSVRYHHTYWAKARTEQAAGRDLPFHSQIIALADIVAQTIKPDMPVLQQAKAITQQVRDGAGELFHPDCAEAFCQIGVAPAFWLDCVSDRIYGIILEQMDWPSLSVDEETVESVAGIFARVVDAASPWTATHTAGVAATAVALAERLNFSPREIVMMRAAGLFHDLGKIAVPPAILNKPGKLTEPDWNLIRAHTYYTFRILNTIGGMPQICEWAAFHHERLDGEGYPFRHTAKQLTLGSRIMAVADVFTAVSEDRPYRIGMDITQAVAILDKLVHNGGLDGDVVRVLKQDRVRINQIRIDEQARYALQQNDLMDSMAKTMIKV